MYIAESHRSSTTVHGVDRPSSRPASGVGSFIPRLRLMLAHALSRLVDASVASRAAASRFGAFDHVTGTALPAFDHPSTTALRRTDEHPTRVTGEDLLTAAYVWGVSGVLSDYDLR